MVTASYRSLRNCADTTGAKSLGLRIIMGRNIPYRGQTTHGNERRDRCGS